jgi:hypothetical protein
MPALPTFLSKPLKVLKLQVELREGNIIARKTHSSSDVIIKGASLDPITRSELSRHRVTMASIPVPTEKCVAWPLVRRRWKNNRRQVILMQVSDIGLSSNTPARFFILWSLTIVTSACGQGPRSRSRLDRLRETSRD